MVDLSSVGFQHGIIKSLTGNYVINPVNGTVDINNEPSVHTIRQMSDDKKSSYQAENCAATGDLTAIIFDCLKYL